MADITVSQALGALEKEVYAQDLIDLVPENTKFLKGLPFREAEKLGDVFVQPVMLSNEHGFTYNADGTVFALEDASPAVFRDAKVQGAEILLRTAISYRDAAKNSSRGTKAFRAWASLLIENLTKSMSKRLEIGHLYGRRGLGIVESKGTATVSGSNTLLPIVLTEKSFASGIWSGMEGATFDVFSSIAVASATAMRNTSAIITLTNVSVETRTLTLSVPTASAAQLNAVVANDILFFKGTRSTATSHAYIEWAGLDEIVNNTGTLFNIDASAFDLWNGNVVAAADAAISMSIINSSIAVAAGKGLDYDVKVLISPSQYEVLNSDNAAQRRFDDSYSSDKNSNGSKMLSFYGQNGLIMIEPNIHIKNADVFIVPMMGDKLKRVGATDMTFRLPGRENEELFKQLDNRAGYEMRLYTDQALFADCIGQLVKIENIKNP